MSCSTTTSQRSQLRKRSSDSDDHVRVRTASPTPFSGHVQSATGAPLVTRNPLELRAFGLEDRADAVISSGSTGWSLNNLSQWRQEMTQFTHHHTVAETTSKAYIAQRQRQFKQQMLRSARPPPSQY